MKTQVLFRKIHHWGSIIVAVPLVVMIGTGIFLMLKKDVDWIQPPTQRGVSVEVPTASLQQMFDAAKSVPEAQLTTWEELDRVDFKPNKGVAKFMAKNRWEVQVDTQTAEVLSVEYRRSDLFETLHDGTWFADWAKLFLFLPVGIVLFFLWLPGVFMFALTEYKKWQKRKKKRS